MGQKVHPTGMRLGIVKDFKAKWYADKTDYAKYLIQDLQVRDFLEKKLKNAAVSDITIERPAQNINVIIHTARPGIVIGKKGEDIDRMRKAIATMTGLPTQVSVEEIRKPEIDSQLVADGICQQLEKRVMFRRAMKRSVQSAMRAGAQGVKVMISGRLNGAEIARSEWYREGRVPLHTLRADIDYATSEALTTYGIIGVKVWIFKGEIFQPINSVVSEETPAA
ncbi:MAG: small subunit ribosomal protein S3 [Cryomorphaceae bacterium]|jgi:small subunit ribosomal protein S3